MHFRKKTEENNRLTWVAIFFLLIALWIIIRLFTLQIIDHQFYLSFASNSHEIFQKLRPHRGAIYYKDLRSGEIVPAAVNQELYQVYAVPREIPLGEAASTTVRLVALFGLDEMQSSSLYAKLSVLAGSYASVAKKIPEAKLTALKEDMLPGVNWTPEEFRLYPEQDSGAPVLGFVGFDAKAGLVGRYGLEGYWEKRLAGSGGFVEGERGALGGWISPSSRKLVKPQDGADLILTIDRNLQWVACNRLEQGRQEYGAKSGSLVLLEPDTGAILAMCSVPSFDPNNYSSVEDARVFNNTAIFGSYEPGSVFKAITMAAGLDRELVSPSTVFTDPCSLIINGHTVRNAERRCWGKKTMTEVLENSINTGVVWVEQKLGQPLFYEYLKRFGFGQKTGITLDTESAGDISSLAKRSEIYGANGSFGQGLTVTPLQLAAAYAALVNGGRLYQPYLVSEIRHKSLQTEKFQPKFLEQVISPRASKLISGMLVSVVENHYRKAKLANYFVGGKTGTAQIAEKGVYSETRTNHTFAGFAPAYKPRFVLVVKYEEPNLPWAELTALPVFRDIMKFATDYIGAPAEKDAN